MRCLKNYSYIFGFFAQFLQVDCQLIFLVSSKLVKGKPLEKVGRKATGLTLEAEKTASRQGSRAAG